MEKLIKKLEESLPTLSSLYFRYCFYSIYEDLLLINYCNDEQKINLYFEEINNFLGRFFSNGKNKYTVDNPTIERDRLITNVTRAFKSVCP